MFVSTLLTYHVVAISIVGAAIVLFFQWSFGYWKKRGLYYPKPSIPFGNARKLLTQKYNMAEQFREFYELFKRKGLKHGGVYILSRPFYVPIDPAIIKNIIQKDFNHFVDRGFYVNEETDPLSGHLFSLEGTKWKNLRAKLTSTFTSGKMKMMFETMAQCAKELDNVMEKVSKNRDPIEVRDILARFTTDVITSCAFGLDGNALKNPNSSLRHYGRRVTENTTLENLRNLVQFMVPAKYLHAINFKTNKSDVEDYILNLVKKTVGQRESNNTYRKDFLHLLIQLKNRGQVADDEEMFDSSHKSSEIGLTMNELAAQVFVFFVAGYETSASTITFTLYEMCQHQDIQNKVRDEIRTVLKKHNGEISYQALMEMTYMDRVINETLRMYPPLAFLNRKCTKAYKVPNTNLEIEEGTMVVIPIYGLHYDPDYYPNPNKYDPDRFLDENKNTRPAFTHIPFGEGPRICIGMRFGLLQTKIGLATFLMNYKVTLNEKTVTPLVMDKATFLLTSKKGIWLNVSKVA